MQRVEAWITLRTAAPFLTVAALDGAGNTLAVLPASEIQRVAGGFRVHLNSPTPWYAITAGMRAPRR
jgi:hypothetical protein